MLQNVSLEQTSSPPDILNTPRSNKRNYKKERLRSDDRDTQNDILCNTLETPSKQPKYDRVVFTITSTRNGPMHWI